MYILSLGVVFQIVLCKNRIHDLQINSRYHKSTTGGETERDRERERESRFGMHGRLDRNDIMASQKTVIKQDLRYVSPTE